jgi:hypothetical protein
VAYRTTKKALDALKPNNLRSHKLHLWENGVRWNPMFNYKMYSSACIGILDLISLLGSGFEYSAQH